MSLGRLLLLALGVVAGGCASIQKERGHKEVADLVAARTGHQTGWKDGTPQSEVVLERVENLLKGGLTRAHAVEVALVNSPELLSTYEELGISQADLLQAGLLSNPSLGGSIGWGRSGSPIEYEASLVGNLLDWFVLPLKKRVAEEQFAAETLRVAHQALVVVGEVRKAFARVQGQVQMVELRRMVVQAAQSAADLAERQRRAGNITELALANEQAAFGQARLDLAQDELELLEQREDLNRLLGLWGPQTDWALAEKLPELPQGEVALEHLESLAIRQRLDIAAARKQALLMTNAVQLATTSRFTGLFQVGVHVHQDPDGPRVWGPTLDVELPIFDQRQAVIGRLEAQERQAQRQLAARSITARSEVRVARARLLNARQVVEHYRTILLPLRERVVEQSQLQYNGMQIGLYELLAAKQGQVEAYRAYIDALRNYWVSSAELERAAGGTLQKVTASTQTPADVKSLPNESKEPAHGDHTH